ncbi:MAG: hypothetical protein Kow0069_35430 [Promethearchaeota archaeon]
MLIGVGEDFFSLLEVETAQEVPVKILDKLKLEKPPAFVKRVRKRLSYSELTPTARDLLEGTVKEIVKEREEHFVKFLNAARPITTRKHQLQLFPGIGKKHLWDVLEAREKEGEFETFEDFERRTGINPHAIIVKRILQEIESEEEKYRLFTRAPPPTPPAKTQHTR